ncbi:MAG: hypothetical protein WC382_13635, partial [Methanoregulaceae archaeon]
MADIRKIVELYYLYGSYKRGGRELNISHNTVRKYIQRVTDVKSGTLHEILPKDRIIKQPLMKSGKRSTSTWNQIWIAPGNSVSMQSGSRNYWSQMATRSATPQSNGKLPDG